MSKEERQAIIHLLDKQARYEYAINNDLSFNDEDYEAYIIRQSMIEKDKEIERLNKRIKNTIEELFELKDMIYKPETREINFDVQRKISSMIVKLGSDKE